MNITSRSLARNKKKSVWNDITVLESFCHKTIHYIIKNRTKNVRMKLRNGRSKSRDVDKKLFLLCLRSK